MTYAEALLYISKQGRFGMKLGIERISAILDRLGNPERGFHGALIAGTNGKGSTGALLVAILRAAGRDVGFMPKPHLVSYTERIELNGRPITEREFVDTLEALVPTFDGVAAEMGQATEFEMLTAMAVAFLAPRTDLLVCEVGLGGRLDATNALDLGLAILTNVELDHQKYLGDTIAKIAAEKAAIIKPSNRIVTGCKGEALRIVEERAEAVGASVWRLDHEIKVAAISRGWEGHLVTVSGPGFEHTDLVVPLLGEFQPLNAALAVAAAHALFDVSDDAVHAGLASTHWPGRLQVLSREPRVVLDGGHNPAALKSAGVALRHLIRGERLVVVFAMLSERDPHQLLAALRTLEPDSAVFTEPSSAAGHAVSSESLAELYGPGAESIRPAGEALTRARDLAGRGGNVLVCGSLYLVGEILALHEAQPESGRPDR